MDHLGRGKGAMHRSFDFCPGQPRSNQMYQRSYCVIYILSQGMAKRTLSGHKNLDTLLSPMCCRRHRPTTTAPHLRRRRCAADAPPRRRLRGRKKAVKAAFDDMISRRTPLYTPPLPQLNASNIWIDDSWVAPG